MRNWVILLFSVSLVGCTSVPLAQRFGPLFNDQLFASPSEHIEVDQIFAVSPQMKHFLETEIVVKTRFDNPEEALFDALYTKRGLRINYDSAMTRTASQTFDAGSANCLSLAIMTAAMAKEIGVKVRYRRVRVEDEWSHVGETIFVAGHVNVTLEEKVSGRGLFEKVTETGTRSSMTIDFIPAIELKRYDTEDLDEQTIVAMYMNNKAAEALASGQLDNAYWWARAALKQDPDFLSAYNTLGVIYQAHGNLKEAEQVLKQALALQPSNVIAMANLANVLKGLGKNEEYKIMAQKVERMQPDRPFYYFDRGRAAMDAGDYKTAKAMFKTEIEREPANSEFQFWFALANWRLGNIGAAEKYMALAMENSTTQKDRDRYAAKLNWFKSLDKTSQ